MRIDQNGNVGIGTTNPAAILDVATTGTGSAIVIPRDTTANRPTSAVNGMIRYNTDTNKFEAYENSGWSNMIGSGSTLAGTNQEVQFNDNGTMGANGNFTYDKATGTLSVLGDGFVTNGRYSAGNGSAGDPSISFVNNSGSGLYAPTTTSLGISANGAERIRISSSGSVGIGTASPSAQLHVTSSIAGNTGGYSLAANDRLAGIFESNPSAGGTNYLVLNNTTAPGTTKGNAILFASQKAGKFILGNDLSGTGAQNFSLMDISTGDTRLFVDASGNVGIGTTVPTSSLEVKSQVAITRTDNDAFGGSWVIRKSRGVATVQNGDELGYTRFDGWDGSAYQSAAGIIGQVDGTPSAGSVPGRLLLSTAGVERMRITSGGRIGIGTNNPGAKLEIASGTANTSGLKFTNFTSSAPTSTGQAVGVDSSGNLVTIAGGGGSGDFKADGSVPMTGNLQLNGHYLSGDGGNEGVFVDSTGNVGLGTGTPESALHIEAADSNVEMKIVNSSSTAARNPQLNLYNFSSGWGGNASLGLIRGRGSKGSPGTIQGGDIFGSIDGKGYKTTSALGTGSQIQMLATNSGWTNTSTPGSIAFLTTSTASTTLTERMRITDAGRVGIGTTTPAYPLTVSASQNSALGLAVNNTSAGTAAESNIFIGKDFTTTWQAGALTYRGSGFTASGNANPNQFEIVSWSGATNGMLIGSEASAPVKFQSNSTERIRITGAGDVGIGTTTPAEKLEVNGNVQAINYFYTSDRRLKQNIRPVEGLELVDQLNGVRFNWRANGKPEVGLIAQEVEQVLPELVNTNPVTGMKAVKYGNLVSPLIQAVKELHGLCKMSDAQIAELGKRVENVERELAGQKQIDSTHDAKIKALEDQVRMLKNENQELKNTVQEIRDMLKERAR
jgi:hypothetical protein